MDTNNQQLKRIGSRLAYGVGDMGINLYFMSTSTFLLFFYTDVFGLEASVAASVFFVARLVDAITDPLMGYWADRTRTRWGRFRPFLLWGAIPLAVIGVAVFTVPELNDFGKIVWVYATYTLFGVIYTVVTIPYASLTSLLTDDYSERASLSTVRIGCAFAGGLCVVAVMLPLVDLMGGPENGGYAWTMVVFGVVGVALLWITFGNVNEVNTLAREQEHLSFRGAMAALFRNPPLWIVVLMFILGMVAFNFRAATAPYYFTYVLERPDLISSYLTLTIAVMFIPLVFLPMLVRNLGKERVIQLGALTAIVGAGGFYLTSAQDVAMVYVWGSLMAIGGTPIAVLGWAMIPDTVEYVQHRFGVRADGVILSTASFLQKLGKMVAGVALPAILAYAGYVANQAQSQDVQDAMLVSIALVPLIANVLLLIACATYGLDATNHSAMVSGIKERIASSGS